MKLFGSEISTTELSQRAVVVALLILIILPLIASVLLPIPEPLPLAQKNLKKVSFTWGIGMPVGDLPRAVDNYVQQAWWGSQTLIRLSNTVGYHLFNRSGVKKMVIGKYGRFLVKEELSHRGFRSRGAFTKKQLAELAQWYEFQQEAAGAVGAKFLLVIVPNKVTVYPESWPEHLTRRVDRNRTDQLVAYLREHTSVSVLDLRGHLLEARNKYPRDLYEHYDSHWNDMGAFIGARFIAKALHEFPTLPKVRIPKMNQYRFSYESTAGDLLEMNGVLFAKDRISPIMTPLDGSCAPPAGLQVTRSPRYFRFVCPGAPRGKLLIMYDSFMGRLIKYLIPFFRETAMYHRSSYMIHPTLLERHQPTVLIDQIVERKLVSLNDYQLELMQAAQAGLPLPPVWIRGKQGMEVGGED
jgi:SGNH hydrolase-like domain, acetyltransferase AlgX